MKPGTGTTTCATGAGFVISRTAGGQIEVVVGTAFCDIHRLSGCDASPTDGTAAIADLAQESWKWVVWSTLAWPNKVAMVAPKS